MRILFVSDKEESASHNAIDAIFDKHLKEHTDIVYFSKTKRYKEHNKIILNSKKDILESIEVTHYNYIIVRNSFKILNQFMRVKNRAFKLGFQLSFPHTYRRFYQAKHERRARARKGIEYFFKSTMENQVLKKVDFFLPISNAMLTEFYPKLKTKFFVLPLGIDEENLHNNSAHEDEIYRFIYIGTVDKLRRFDILFEGFSRLKAENYRLDIYTADLEYATSLLKKYQGIHVYIHQAIDRALIFDKIKQSDVGIFTLPVTKLYYIASPTKVMEYYQCEVPTLSVGVDECRQILDKGSAFFTIFNPPAIAHTLRKILKTPKEELKVMGKRGQELILQKRNYGSISNNFKQFLEAL